MLKNEEIRRKYRFFRKGLNNFEAEWITCSCIYKVRKRECKDYCDFVDIEYQKLISHSFTSALWLITLMWNDFFLDAATNLKEREIFLIEPVFTLLKLRCAIENIFHAINFILLLKAILHCK